MMRITVVVLLTFLIGACSGPSASPDATPCSIDIEWGPERITDFEAYADGDPAEITLGFQGLRYIITTVRMRSETGGTGQLWFQIDVDGHEAYSLSSAVAVPDPEGDGARYLDYALVYFNDIPMPELVGRNASISARLVFEGCSGVHGATVELRNDDDCIEEEDGGLTCTPDAGL